MTLKPGDHVTHTFGAVLRVLRVHADGIEAMSATPSVDYATFVGFYTWAQIRPHAVHPVPDTAQGIEMYGVTPDTPKRS